MEKQLIETIENRRRANDLTKVNKLLLMLFYKENSIKSNETLETLTALKQEHENLNIYSVNVSKIRDIHTQYNVTAVPTLLVFRDGKPAEIIKGKQTLKFYEKLLKKIDISYESDEEGKRSHNVTVYSTPTCPYCNSVKEYLDGKGVTYDEVDVSQDQAAAQELVAKTGQQGVPQTDIDGEFVIGFDISKLDSLLNQ
jgi:glutaredoxin-like YruB-family protein